MAQQEPDRPTIRACRPAVAGVAEVLHAHFPRYAYPSHPRHVEATGFRKRVVYLEEDAIDVGLVGAAVDHPGWAEAGLRAQVHAMHGVLDQPGDDVDAGFEAEVRLALVVEALQQRLTGTTEPPVRRDRPLAHRLRDLLDARVADGVTLPEAARVLGAHPTHLVRAFGGEFGIPPHRYLTGRRLDRARRLLLAGERPADVAAVVGFHDQSHLTRHFRRLLGVTPAAYARSAQ